MSPITQLEIPQATGFLPAGAGARMFEKGLLLRFKKEIPQAIEVLEKAFKLFQKNKNLLGMAYCQIELAWLYGSNQERARSEKQFREAEDIIQNNPGLYGIHEALAHWLHYKGLLLYHKSEFGSALKLFKEALTFCNPQGMEAAKIYDSLGVHYERTGDFHRAVRYLKASLVIKTHLGELLHEEAVTCQILGRLYLLYEDYELAYQHLKRSLDISSRLKDEKRKVALNNELIRLFLRFGKEEAAYDLIRKTRKECQIRHLKIQHGMTCFYEAYLLFRRGDIEASQKLLDKEVFAVFNKCQYRKGLAMAKRLNAWLTYSLCPENTGAAIALVGEAIELFRWENMIDEVAKSHYEMGKLYHDMKNDKLALASFLDALKMAEENGLFYLMPYIEDEIFRTHETQWREIVNKRARHERIFEKRHSLLDTLSELAPEANDSQGIPFLVSLLKVGQAMAAERDLDKLLRLIQQETERALNAGCCMVYLYDADDNTLWAPFSDGSRFSAQQGLAGYVVKTGEILNIENTHEDPRFNREIDGKHEMETENMLCIPMFSRKGSILGVFQVVNKRTGVFTVNDEELLAAIASSGGIAVENAQLYQEQKMTFDSFIETLSSTIDARDPITAGHSERVMHYALLIGEKIQLSDQEMENLKYAALLHDIGKIGVKEEILMKQGRLTENEYKHIQAHVRCTYDILKNIRFERHLRDVPEIAASHHEKMDGSGYFRGLKGENIPFGGRILAVADVFDAITSRRQYRVRMPFDRAMTLLMEDAGQHFDPDVMEMFLQVGLKNLLQVLCMDLYQGVDRADVGAILAQIPEDLTIRNYLELLNNKRCNAEQEQIIEQFTYLYHLNEVSPAD